MAYGFNDDRSKVEVYSKDEAYNKDEVYSKDETENIFLFFFFCTITIFV